MAKISINSEEAKIIKEHLLHSLQKATHNVTCNVDKYKPDFDLYNKIRSFVNENKL
tara:strand:+ start:2268 stop:2435 length:168 start_codon:yes stop_codon:yes gene_type:complete